MFEIFADEAWTHHDPDNRYWRFFGGFMAEERHAASIRTELEKVWADHGHTREVKWTAVSSSTVDAMRALTDVVVNRLDRGELVFRQMFADRRYVRVVDPGDSSSELDGQFKLYYQFLKHMFGCEYCLPSNAELFVRLDTHSSQQHKERLQNFVCALPRIWRRDDLIVRVTYHKSSRMPLMQMADLFMGAAGSHGNKQAQRRPDGKRGMSPKQRLRDMLARHIYDGLRSVDANHRGTRGFNWFETTGGKWDPDSVRHPVRIWNFKPSAYQLDRGWDNSQLDKFGRYQGPQVDPTVHRLGNW